MGDIKLLQKCKTLSTIPLIGNAKYIFIFDRDNPGTITEVSDGIHFKKWADKVFSLSIPTPQHRRATPDISIEFYYSDGEIKREDVDGRRLFINNEFHKESQRHKSMNLFCTEQNKFKKNGICIIDNAVYDISNKNVALPKKKYSRYVLDQVRNFNDFDFTHFSNIFDEIREIARL